MPFAIPFRIAVKVVVFGDVVVVLNQGGGGDIGNQSRDVSMVEQEVVPCLAGLKNSGYEGRQIAVVFIQPRPLFDTRGGAGGLVVHLVEGAFGVKPVAVQKILVGLLKKEGH